MQLLVVFVSCNMLAFKACEILPVIFRCTQSQVLCVMYQVGENVVHAGQLNLYVRSHTISLCYEFLVEHISFAEKRN